MCHKACCNSAKDCREPGQCREPEGRFALSCYCHIRMDCMQVRVALGMGSMIQPANIIFILILSSRMLAISSSSVSPANLISFSFTLSFRSFIKMMNGRRSKRKPCGARQLFRMTWSHLLTLVRNRCSTSSAHTRQ